MSDSFYAHWFRGLDAALSAMDEGGVDALLTHCGRACADSYPMRRYAQLYRGAETLDEFIARLDAGFDGLSARRIGEDEIEIVYPACGCELVRGGHVKNPKLCLCSLKSLQYIWESLLGAGCVACRMEQSILQGGDRCRFIVKLLCNARTGKEPLWHGN